MLRVFVGLAAVWLFAGGFASVQSSACGRIGSPQRECKPCKRPDGTLNHPPNVTDLVLDRSEIRLADVAPGEPAGDNPAAMLINIATTAVDAENDVLDYAYVVSAGHIVGSGSAVQWDLSGVGPGTYSITAKVDDSCGVCGSTKTKLVRLVGRTVPTIAPMISAAPAGPSPAPASISTRATVVAPAITPPARTAPPLRATVPTQTSSATAKPQAPSRATGPAPTSVSITKASVPTTPAGLARSTPPAVTRNSVPAMNALASSPPPGKPCSCPIVSISDPEREGSDLIFTTKVDGLLSNQLSFLWTVVGGKVVSQDKRSIRINPGTVAVGGSVNVIVNGLEPRCSCPNRAQKTF